MQVQENNIPPPPTRRPRPDRHPAAQPTDIAHQIFAAKRKAADATRRPDRTAQPVPSTSTSTPTLGKMAAVAVAPTPSSSRAHQPQTLPQPPLSPPRKQRPQQSSRAPTRPSNADELDGDFDRRLPVSSPKHVSSPTAGSSRPPGKLYNPDVDSPIPTSRIPSNQHPALMVPRHREADLLSESSTGHAHPHPSRVRIKGLPQQHQSQQQSQNNSARQLFDPSKDDPMRFAVLARASNSKSLPSFSQGYYPSASLTSQSDSQSIGSNFTLTSESSSSSVSHARNGGQAATYPRAKQEDQGSNPFVTQLKKLYRDICTLEGKLITASEASIGEDADADFGGAARGVEGPTLSNPPTAAAPNRGDPWESMITEHKRLVDACHDLLQLALNPRVPASVKSIPSRYNIPTRLWSVAFQKLISNLRRASHTSPRALEHLTDFIYYGYSFYTVLWQDENLKQFRGMWIEALGDLASYRQAVALQVKAATAASTSRSGMRGLTPDPVSSSRAAAASSAAAASGLLIVEDAFNPESSVVRGHGSAPSIGLRVAADFEGEDEVETWRTVGRHWYAQGLADTPGAGRLHHHLGHASRDKKGDELRAVYHFAKSLIASQMFDQARETITGFFNPALFQRLSQPTSGATEIFLLLHGMLFARVDFDKFDAILGRFIERLQLDDNAGVGEGDWVMMAVLNIAAILEYRKPDGAIRMLTGTGESSAAAKTSVKVSHQRSNSKSGKRADSLTVEGDGFSPSSSSSSRAPVINVFSDEDQQMAEPESVDNEAVESLPRQMQELSTTDYIPVTTPDPALKFAMQLTFTLLVHILRSPILPANEKTHTEDRVNPYLTVVMTFLATVFENPSVLALMEQSVPWDELVGFLTQARLQDYHIRGPGSSNPEDLSSGGPLPEDSCLRGMEWLKRKVFPGGFWKKYENDIVPEMDVIAPPCVAPETVGPVDGSAMEVDAVAPPTVSEKRWRRLKNCAEALVKHVPGLVWVGGEADKDIIVDEPLMSKRDRWLAEKVAEEERERQMRRRSGFDEDEDASGDFGDYEDDEDDEDISVEVKALKARRQYLQGLVSHEQPHRSRAKPRAERRKPLALVPGYTVLVVDTNILLAMLNEVASLIESNRWTVVVPLPVITELDGLSKNTTPLGQAAISALAYLTTTLPQSMSLKVQTSRGNYLRTLSIRSEITDFGSGQDGQNQNRNMDDLILQSAWWQAENFIDRSTLLQSQQVDDLDFMELSSPITPGQNTSRVVLLTFDRNLRLKARARKLDAADEKDMVAILGRSR